tara:strand:- start:9581 stop:10312 length:732 start_codon:yes stop_codon:yes gene_type:complete
MKNIIFIMDVDLQGSTTSYKYSIDSWKCWAAKNDAEVFILNDTLMPNKDMDIRWQRYYLFDILESNNIEYNQIAMVNANTIIHPNAPNFFELTNNKFTGVFCDSNYDQVIRSLENYSKYIFNGLMPDLFKYIDNGFMIVNKKHKEFFVKITNFYHENSELLREIETKLQGGVDQTPVNILIHKENIDLKLLPYEYNMVDMRRKEILQENMVFTKIGYIYQFNDQATYYWMKKTYEYLYGELND